MSEVAIAPAAPAPVEVPAGLLEPVMKIDLVECEVPLTGKAFAAWTDGSVRGERASWAFVRDDGHLARGALDGASINDVEMRALVEAVRSVPEGAVIHLNSDSHAALGRAARVVPVSGIPAFARTDDDPLIAELATLARRRVVVGHWVRGHGVEVRNHLADQLAGLGTSTRTAKERTRFARGIKATLRVAFGGQTRDCTCFPEGERLYATSSESQSKALTSVASIDLHVLLDDALAHMRNGAHLRAEDEINQALRAARRAHHDGVGSMLHAGVRASLDVTAPGWGGLSATHLHDAWLLRRDQPLPEWDRDWLGIISSGRVAEHADALPAWIESVRRRHDQWRVLGVATRLRQQVPGLLSGEPAAELAARLVEASASLPDGVAGATLPPSAPAPSPTAFVTPSRGAGLALADDAVYLRAARAGRLGKVMHADAWLLGVRSRSLSHQQTLDFNDAMPGWQSRSVELLDQQWTDAARVSGIKPTALSASLPKNVSADLTHAVDSLDALCAARARGRLAEITGADAMLTQMRHAVVSAQMPKRLKAWVDTRLPGWLTSSAREMDDLWERSTLSWTIGLVEPLAQAATRGLLSSEKHAARWLTSLRALDESGLLPEAAAATVDAAAPGWRTLTAVQLDRQWLRPAGAPAEPVAADVAEPTDGAPDPVAATLIQQALALGDQLQGLADRLDAAHPGWRAQGDTETAPAEIAPAPSNVSDISDAPGHHAPSALQALAEARDRREEAQREEEALLAAAVADGASVRQVASVLGVSATTAHRRMAATRTKDAA